MQHFSCLEGRCVCPEINHTPISTQTIGQTEPNKKQHRNKAQSNAIFFIDFHCVVLVGRGAGGSAWGADMKST